MANTVDARMSLAKDGETLVVKGTIANGTAAPIWVLDSLDGERAIVSRGDKGTARIVFGFLGADSQMPEIEQGIAREPMPAATKIAAGATRTRTVKLALPLAPWHPYLEMARLKEPSSIVLEVGYVDAEPANLGDVKTKQKWARSGPATVP